MCADRWRTRAKRSALPSDDAVGRGSEAVSIGLQRQETRRLAFTAAQPDFCQAPQLRRATESAMPADTAHWLELTEFAHCEPNALAFRALVALLDTRPRPSPTPTSCCHVARCRSTCPMVLVQGPDSGRRAADRQLIPRCRTKRCSADSQFGGTFGPCNLMKSGCLGQRVVRRPAPVPDCLLEVDIIAIGLENEFDVAADRLARGGLDLAARLRELLLQARRRPRPWPASAHRPPLGGGVLLSWKLVPAI